MVSAYWRMNCAICASLCALADAGSSRAWYLASAGCTDDAARGAIDSLQDALVRLCSGERAADNPNHMPEQVILPEPKAVEPEPQLEVVAGNDHLDVEGAMLDRMRKLQVGSWLQLATSADRVEPAKVSWISPISSRLLLVNRRGIRFCVASPEELAVMVRLGRLRMPPDAEVRAMWRDLRHWMNTRLLDGADAVAGVKPPGLQR